MPKIKVTKVRLTKLSSNKNRLRTDVIEGHTATWPPKIGESWAMWGEGLSDKTKTREVTTSPVQSITKKGSYWAEVVVQTQNSTYRIEKIK